MLLLLLRNCIILLLLIFSFSFCLRKPSIDNELNDDEDLKENNDKIKNFNFNNIDNINNITETDIKKLYPFQAENLLNKLKKDKKSLTPKLSKLLKDQTNKLIPNYQLDSVPAVDYSNKFPPKKYSNIFDKIKKKKNIESFYKI